MNNMGRLRASLEEFAQFGCPVDSSVAVTAAENERVEIEQVGGILESQVFELPDRRVAYMAYIAVTNQRARSIDVIDVELRTPWDNRLFQWLLPTEVKSRPTGSGTLASWFIGSRDPHWSLGTMR